MFLTRVIASPFCDKSNIVIDSYFNHTASSKAVLVKIVVAETYWEWKNATNPFRVSKYLEPVVGIPALHRVHRVRDQLTFTVFSDRFENLTALEHHFS